MCPRSAAPLSLVDADKDGCNTRAEVLKAEAVAAPEQRVSCRLSGGLVFAVRRPLRPCPGRVRVAEGAGRVPSMPANAGKAVQPPDAAVQRRPRHEDASDRP